MKKLILTVLFFSSFFSLAFAQTGKIAGKVVDNENGEELIGATVLITELSMGEAVDFNGNYLIDNVPAGTYNLKVQFVSYATKIISDVEVVGGQTTTLNISLSSDDLELQEVIVTAKAIKDNDVAMLALRKKSLAVQDGISSMEIAKLGISNAAESIKSIPGASVEGGKYVVMRGLGDRYTLTMLDGVILPSANPYKNAASLDIIPANVIQTVNAQKTFTPDIPGNFAGGALNIETVSLPDQFYLKVGASAGFNSVSSFQNDFNVDAIKGSTDWLGYDDGSRALPGIAKQNAAALKAINPFKVASNNEQYDVARNFLNDASKSLAGPFVPAQETSSINSGMSIAFGDTRTLKKNRKLGYNFSISHNNDYDRKGSYVNNVFEDAKGDKTGLANLQGLQGISDSKIASISSLLKLSFQFNPNHEVGITGFYNHEGSSNVNQVAGSWAASSTGNVNLNEVQWIERQSIFTQFYGKHFFPVLHDAKLTWAAGYTDAGQDEPNRRIFAYGIRDNVPSLSPSEFGLLPTNFYRNLKDQQKHFKVDLTIPVGQANNKLKFGTYYSSKDRTFGEDRFGYNGAYRNRDDSNPLYKEFGSFGVDDLAGFFSTSNVGIVNTPEQNGLARYGYGNIYTNTTLVGNSYIGSETIIATYGMGSFTFARLTATFGARIEYTDLSASSANDALNFNEEVVQEGGRTFLYRTRLGVIQGVDVLPSLNLTYKLTDRTKLIAGFSQTVGRPNMREIAAFNDFFYGTSRGGNPNLKRAKNTMYDLRYEIYPSPTELVAFSVFYKDFKDPIVRSIVAQASNVEIRPQNVDRANVYGAEVELRKNLGFFGEVFNNFSFNTNFSYIFSQRNKEDDELALLEKAQSTGLYSYIKSTRPFQGQSPFILNIGLSHRSDALNWDNTISFNTFGDRLAFVNTALNPDIYEKSRGTLNFTSIKKFGEHWKGTLKIRNILNPAYQFEYDYEGGSEIFQSYKMGIDFSLGVGYSF